MIQPQPLDSAHYAQRRSELLQQLEPDCIAIISASALVLRNGDAHYRFRQGSDFWYTTGFPEPDALLVLRRSPEAGEQYTLLCRPRDAEREVWDGRRIGLDGAKELYGADCAYDIAEADKLLPQWLDGAQSLYFPWQDSTLSASVTRWLNTLGNQRGARPPERSLNLTPLLHQMRLYKTPAEAELMRYAANVAASAHRRAMQCVRAGMWEYQLEAEYMHEFMRHGARDAAYCSIVGGGDNACVLHYIDNDQQLRDGDMVLVDAGCEYQGYASDITRTFPVNGTFSPRQRELYEVVLGVNKTLIDNLHQGISKQEVEQSATRLLTQGLVDLGILRGTVDELIESGSTRRFYMHGVAHWLGLDVHDAGPYTEDDGSSSRILRPNMAFTIEPGLYISQDDTQVDEAWRGIGIRVEDDILIREDGVVEVLSSSVPKEVDEISDLMRAVQE